MYEINDQRFYAEPFPSDGSEYTLKTKLEYPLLAFFLHNEDDQDVSEFLSQKGAQLDALTGEGCLIYLYEKPSKWDEGWKAKLKERYGLEFDKKFAEWEKESDYTRNEKIQILTKRLDIPYNHLPCMIFIENLYSNDLLMIPFVAKKDYFKDYFRDILTCIQKAGKAPQGKMLSTMKSEWRRYWIKWIASEKIKTYANEFQEWGSIIVKTKDTCINIVDVISPIFKGISTALKVTG
jgi:hypothetical protein